MAQTVTTDQPHIVIIGGGIAGLSAAWFLQRHDSFHVTVLEQGGRWGGKVLTERVDVGGAGRFIVEAGPDSFLTAKPWAHQLARELGLDESLLPTNDRQPPVYVLQKGRPVPLPEGVMLTVPTRIVPFALSRLISPLGKLRMAMDAFIPARDGDDDESLADFVRRRLGQEALDKLAEPLMSGIYNADAEDQSLLATFPRFRQVEKQYGSLVRGMIAARRNRPQSSSNSDSPPSMFMSFRQGTQTLTDQLVANLNADLRLNCGVQTISSDPEGGYVLDLGDGDSVRADVVILAIPAHAATTLVEPLAYEAAGLLKRIRYAGTGTISLGYRSDDLKHVFDGFGVVIPRAESRAINAVTISSNKFDQRAPHGHGLLRAFFGGSRSPESMDLDDKTLLDAVRREMRDIFKIEAEPLFHRIYRWHNANPQYAVGHLDLVDEIEAALPPGMFVTGSAYRGVGLPDCVFQSRQVAAQIVETFGSPVVATVQS